MSFAWEMPPVGRAAETAMVVAATVPVLESARLRLRAPDVRDFAAYAEIFTSDRARHMGGPYSREGAWHDFCQAVASWMLRGMGVWSIERKADGVLVGFGYLWQEFGDPEPEIGWVLTLEAEGNGYASEAAAAILPHAMALFGAGGVVSYIDADNHRSARVAEKLGARRDPAAEAALQEDDLHIYRHFGPEDRA